MKAAVYFIAFVLIELARCVYLEQKIDILGESANSKSVHPHAKNLVYSRNPS